MHCEVYSTQCRPFRRFLLSKQFVGHWQRDRPLSDLHEGYFLSAIFLASVHDPKCPIKYAVALIPPMPKIQNNRFLDLDQIPSKILFVMPGAEELKHVTSLIDQLLLNVHSIHFAKKTHQFQVISTTNSWSESGELQLVCTFIDSIFVS